MKTDVGLSGIAISMLALCGCANPTASLNAVGNAVQNIGSAGSVHGKYAYVGAKTKATLPSFLNNPKTVWVPAVYSSSGHSTLYINGQPLLVRGEIADVASFLHSGRGYIVAVRERNLRVAGQAVPLERSGIIFYRVSASGQVGQQIGYFVASPYVNVVNSGKAIFLQEPVSGNDRPALYRFYGYNSHGRRVQGPQGVPFASPAPGGGWYIEQVTGRSAYWDVTPGFKAEIVLRSPDGQQTIKTAGLNIPYGSRHFEHTTGAFINKAPVTDTARTGAILRAYTGHYLGLDLVRLSQPMSQSCEGVIGKICQHHGVYQADIEGGGYGNAIQQSSVLFGSPGAQYLAMPYDIGSITPYGMVAAVGPLTRPTAKATWTNLFPARGSIRGGYALPAYGLIGPHAGVVVNADPGSTKSGISYAIKPSATGMQVALLNPNAVSQFLSQYGFRQVPVYQK